MAPRSGHKGDGKKTIAAQMLIAAMKEVKRGAGRRCSRQRRKGEQVLLGEGGLMARKLLRANRGNRKGGQQVMLVDGGMMMKKQLEDNTEQPQVTTPFVNELGHSIPVEVLDLFFSDETTQRLRSIIAYAEMRAPILQVTLPGGDNRTLTKSADHATNLMAALLDWIVCLYELGFSLGGNFGPADFGITHLGFLKGLRNLLHQLRPRTDLMAIKDMDAVANVTENDIFKSVVYGPLPADVAPLPVDVADLIIILRNFDSALIPLLQIHVSREKGSRKDMLYTIMYNRLVVIESENPQVYKNIMKKIQKRNWIHKAMSNVHLHEVLRFQSRPTSLAQKILYFLSNKIRYKPETAKLLVFRRDAIAHLLKDYSFVVFAGAEEGLRAALAFAVDREQSIARAVSDIPQNIPKENAQELQAIMLENDAKLAAATIETTLQCYKTSSEIATKAAGAAVIQRFKQPNPASEKAKREARFEARRVALPMQYSSAPAGVHGAQAAVQAVVPRRMFNEEEIADMLAFVDPELLHELQRGLFEAGELQMLQEHAKTVAIRLLS